MFRKAKKMSNTEQHSAVAPTSTDTYHHLYHYHGMSPKKVSVAELTLGSVVSPALMGLRNADCGSQTAKMGWL